MSKEQLRPRVEITVVDVKGSAPREPGAKMIWYPSGATDSTIGGGNLEQQSIAEAANLWADPERHTAFLEFPLSAKLGQCCGGYVRLFLEKRLPPREVLICGAGHVSTALAAILAETPLKISVVDARGDWASAERFPNKVSAIADDPEALVREWGERAGRTYILIMTHDHPLDQALCQLALRFPFLWIGLIGSRTKWLRFRQRMAVRGFTAEELARITSPIGDPALGRTPQEIAVGVAAQLLRLYHGAGLTERATIASDREAPAGPRGALILAGGASSRMGQWKGGLDYQGEPLIAAHARTFTEAGADCWKAVYPAKDQAVAEKAIGAGHRVMNPIPEAPMFASLQLGLRALIAEQIQLSSIMVAPVDTLPLDSDLLAALWDRHEGSGAWVTRPAVGIDHADGKNKGKEAGGLQYGHPIVIDQRLFAPILAADPATARLDFLVRDLPEELKATLEFPNAAALANLNTPEEYAAVLNSN